MSEGNFFDVPEDSKNTRLLIYGYNPNAKAAVTFFNDPNCSYKPALIRTGKDGEARTYDKEEMFERGMVKNDSPSWSFMIPKGHKMERCYSGSDCVTYYASSW